MQFVAENRRNRHDILSGGRKLKHELPNEKNTFKNLQFYNIPPTEDITLDEFDEIAIERLKTLKTFEDIKERFPLGSKDFQNAARTSLQKSLPIAVGACNKEDLSKWRRRDLIGHFILRLAFCRTPEDQKWFIQQEVDLFKFRFMLETESNICLFLQENAIRLSPVHSDERDSLISELCAACDLSADVLQITKFWKIDFEQALELVRRRRAYLSGGMAYVQFNDLVSIVSTHLRANISSAMARSFKHLAIIEEEGRILPRLQRLANNAYSGKQYDGKENSDKITKEMIDKLCSSSFPLCMKQIHHRFRTDHHLRHGARRQYGLFLKALGLSLEEALRFMREEFTKKIDSDKFDKEYAYNVRHMYGKEGRRTDYPAFPCSTIILSNPPAAGDCHGCPYKHSDPQVLSQRLQKEGLSKIQIDQILNLSKGNAFDKACTRFFEYSHKMEEGALGQLITHPNHYYELSQEVLSGSRTKENHLISSYATSQSSNVPATANKHEELMEWDD